EHPGTRVALMAFPDRLREVMTVKWPEEETRQVLIRGGNVDSRWIVNGKPVGEVPSAADAKQGLLRDEACRLVPLLGGDRFRLRLVGPGAMVEGREAVVVAVSSKELKETRLFFDKKTGLRVKMEVDRSGSNGQQELFEDIVLDHKQVKGRWVPSKF